MNLSQMIWSLGYISKGMPERVPQLFGKMSVKPDEVALTLLFNAFAQLTNANAIKTGREVLKQMPRSFLDHENLVNSAMDMLMKFGDVAEAESLFERLKRKSVVSYGALMKGNSHNVPSLEGVKLIVSFRICHQ